jgi:hypothetical protein
VIVEVSRVSEIYLPNLLGHDESLLAQHEFCNSRSTAIWLARVDGVEAGACGIIPGSIFADEAYLWMIHTKICEQHPVHFIRWSRKILNEVLLECPSLFGLCRVDNDYGRQWLTWLGMRFEPTVHNGFIGFRVGK